ncbi:uncharacterized protein LOC109840523 isoform X2 [Asparagus officinalis]|nr:uncharacterized protein LOC109840523 isoform X2 [Asparagus officinalis]
MVLDSLSSPHRRSPPSFSFSVKKPTSGQREWGSCSALFERHRFLLTMLILLVVLCTVYLYFAVTLGGREQCSGLSGAEKELCKAELSALHKGKLRLF